MCFSLAMLALELMNSRRVILPIISGIVLYSNIRDLDVSKMYLALSNLAISYVEK